jgi:3',5'-cyclic AMP phosphodiesterase CpdA
MRCACACHEDFVLRTIVHLSDLHFGRVDARLLQPLAALVNQLRPDLVAVSGDLTQRAKPEQFIAARAWLDTLLAPKLVVPGNHDIPYYRVWERFLSPLGNYRKYIDGNVEPDFVDEEMAVVGINSARSLTFKGGRVNAAQLERLRARLAPLPASLLRIVVTHHPFAQPEGADEDDIVGRAPMATAVFRELGIDLMLSGHVHTSLAARIDGHAALVVQAGTATSTRGRGEVNSFNVLRIDGDQVDIERHGWGEQQRDYRAVERQRFVRGGRGWQPVAH